MQPPFALSTATRRNGGNKKGSVPTVEGTRRSARQSGGSKETEKAARDKATRLKRKQEKWNEAHFGTEVTTTRERKQSKLALGSSSSSSSSGGGSAAGPPPNEDQEEGLFSFPEEYGKEFNEFVLQRLRLYLEKRGGVFRSDIEVLFRALGQNGYVSTGKSARADPRPPAATLASYLQTSKYEVLCSGLESSAFQRNYEGSKAAMANAKKRKDSVRNRARALVDAMEFLIKAADFGESDSESTGRKATPGAPLICVERGQEVPNQPRDLMQKWKKTRQLSSAPPALPGSLVGATAVVLPLVRQSLSSSWFS
jgi:hypothetical protein